MSEERDQPVAEEGVAPESMEEVADEANAQGDEQLLDDDGNPIEGDADDDSEEFEHEGVKHKLPKAIAKELREGTLRQQDYTRKTQEVAEQRRTVEARAAELQQQAELSEQTLEERATLKLVNQQIAAYRDMDWDAYAWNNRTDADPYGMLAVQKALAIKSQLESDRDELKSTIASKEQEHIRLSSERAANARQEATKQLQEAGLTPQLESGVKLVAQHFGFTPQELEESLVDRDGKPDTRSYRLLARLVAAESELHHLKTQAKKAQTAERQAAVQPAKTVKANAGQYKPGLDDSLPADEWLRRRNAQLAKAR